MDTEKINEVFDQQVTFADLGLRDSVLKGLEKAGFIHPTHIQSQLIRPMLEGRDLLGQAKTGTGKTAAFALPLLHRCEQEPAVQAIVLAPTRELAIQIVHEINELGQFTPIKAIGITGGASFDKQRKGIKDGAQIVVGTPGRVMDLHRRRDLPFDNVNTVILDEVDRMLDIGFRDDIRKLLGMVKGEHQTIFVSATISGEIERLGRKFMKNDAEKIETVAKSLTVSQVHQTYLPVAKHDKMRLLAHLLKHEEPALTVVFCRMKVTVRDVTRHLKKAGIDAHEIHGDLRQTKRNQIMDRLRSGKLEVLVASDLAARGIDIEGITHVINFDLPEDPEIYVHRIGRTARAGREGTAWSFVTPDEGQRLTEIEKLAGIMIEKLEYPDFKPSEPSQKARNAPEKERTLAEAMADRTAAEAPTADPNKFPGGVVPKGPPPRGLGGRVKRRRR